MPLLSAYVDSDGSLHNCVILSVHLYFQADNEIMAYARYLRTDIPAVDDDIISNDSIEICWEHIAMNPTRSCFSEN